MPRLIALIALLLIPAAARAEADGPALWVVRDDDTTVYLFGTYHALPGGVDWYRGPVVDAFEAADELLFETIEPEGELDAALAERFVLAEGKSLRARLPGEMRVHFDTAIARAGMPLQVADRMKPWVAAFMLGGADPTSRAWRGERGVETVLAERAKAAGKPVGEIEGSDRQTEILDGMPNAVQLAFLRQAIRPRSAADLALERRTLEAWRTGDIATFTAGVEADYADDPEVTRVILTQRNEEWAGWIAERMARPGTILVAVGSAHLAGAGSLQDRLALRQVKAERVR